MTLAPYKLAKFPRLDREGYIAKSPESTVYNCVAYALGKEDTDNSIWWPWPDCYWPEGAPDEETEESFEIVFLAEGFERCEHGELERGFEKIVLYGSPVLDKPKHVARQLLDGRWASKLGVEWEDIEHDTVTGLQGGTYGVARRFYKKPRKEPEHG